MANFVLGHATLGDKSGLPILSARNLRHVIWYAAQNIWLGTIRIFSLASSRSALGIQKQAETSDQADDLIEKQLSSTGFDKADTNDHLYRWEASKYFDPTPLLG